MTRDELHAAAMALPGAELDIKWGDDHCYCVGGKMFAATDGAYTGLSFKASDIAFEALTSTGRAEPARYLARARWVSLKDLGSQDAAEVADWLKTAHALVAARLPGKQRKALGIA
jgi:predicted DNA-binding protein (MmcQ/YjbR family)